MLSTTIIRGQTNNVVLITSPRPKESIIPLSNLISILEVLCNELYVITGNEGATACEKYEVKKVFSIRYKTFNNLLLKIILYILLQSEVSFYIIKLRNKFDVAVFFMGEGLLLPLLILKMMKRDVILSLAASAPQIIKAKKHISFANKILIKLELLNYRFCNNLILYSPILVRNWHLEEHIGKIQFAREHYVDLDKFNRTRGLNERKYLVGYVGRMSEEKGPLNFVKAVPKIISMLKQKKVFFLLAGDGVLRENINAYIKSNNLEHLAVPGRVKTSEYLNDIKLLIIPSYTEGLPNIMLEAMACGTPVLATPVGAIPDIIKDGETGFLMESNSPECIAANVIRALEHQDLEGVADRARALVEREFTFEKAVERWRAILEEVSDGSR